MYSGQGDPRSNVNPNPEIQTPKLNDEVLQEKGLFCILRKSTPKS